MSRDPVDLRPPAQTIDQHWDRLAGWLERQGHHLDRDPEPRQFSGGAANLNYLISLDGTPVVLRRPPAGPMAEGAGDMAREWRVLSNLPRTFDLAPRGILFGDDETVLGAPFQIIEYRPGIAVGPHLPESLAGRPGIPGTLTDSLITTMAALHAIDPEAAGLGTLGRPEGFLARQVEGWIRRAHAAYDGEPPKSAARIGQWLRQAGPSAPSNTVLLHCDLKLDNLLVTPEGGQPVALIDWDMATRGDPMFDLAVLLSYWAEPGDPEPVRTINQVPSLEPGFPSRRQVAERYFAAAGMPPQDLGFHVTLARLRFAVAWQQLYRLYQRGALTDPRYATFATTAEAVLDWTADSLTSSSQ